MEKQDGLRIFHRKQSCMADENIFGERGVRFLYENPVGYALESTLLSRPGFSKLYGAYQDSTYSARAIPSFIRDFKIPMQDYEAGPFRTFNDFFIRRFKPGLRPFEAEPRRFSAPAEGRYLCFPKIDADTHLPIKGATLNGPALLGSGREATQDPELSKVDLSIFEGGPGFIARLCPVDYHRFHFPDFGKIIARARLRGPLHSVNPIALRKKGDLLFRNQREVTILETKNFGRIAYVEVGAICVGKIVQTLSDRREFTRGEEKGYFLFGGSTIIVIGERGSFTLDPDLIAKSAEGVESLIQLGEGIATKSVH